MSPMPPDAVTAEARRALTICNICGYCNGLCPVFDAARRRPALHDADLEQLAHLCHDCRACLYDCQYAPPHAFAINLPRALARLRWSSYATHAWPRPLAALFRGHARAASALAAAIVLLVMAAVLALTPADVLFARETAPGAFYRIVPHAIMVAGGLLSLGWALLAIAMAMRRFSRHTNRTIPPTPAAFAPLFATIAEVARLTHLRGGGPGCHEHAGPPSQRRRWLHQTLVLGVLLCLAATLAALGYHAVLDWPAPYPLTSAPVLLGTAGGAAMLIGAIGLGWTRWRADPEPLAAELQGADRAALALLLLVVGTGLALLGWRATTAMGLLLALHLGTVLALFALLPYSRLIHGAYRLVALLRDARERHSENSARHN